jgi:hypothetical protein
MLESCHSLGGNRYVKIFLREFFSYYITGEQSASLYQASTIKKVVQLEDIKIIII